MSEEGWVLTGVLVLNLTNVEVKSHMTSLGEQVAIRTLLNFFPHLNHFLVLVTYLFNHAITEIVYLSQHL